MHEDVPWTTRALIEARRVRYSTAPLIHYRKPLRPPNPGPVQDARLRLLIESSAFNASSLDKLIVGLSNRGLAKQIAWQLVDGGLSIFHHMAKIDSPVVLQDLRRMLRNQGFYALLWHYASTLPQHRRIARNWLKSFT